MGDEEKIALILEWAEDHPKFDTGFVEQMQDALNEWGQLTSGQSNALDNIIEKFNIEEWSCGQTRSFQR